MSTNEGGRPDPLPRTPHAALTQPDSPHGPCERVIETVLSRLYVFPDAIYKWYRPAEAYYGNVRDMPHRRVFFTNDFEWNATVSPSVYLELVGIRYDDDGLSFSRSPLDEADDYLIKMRPVSRAATLSELLIDDAATPSHIEQAVLALFAAQRRLHARFMNELSDVRERGLPELYAENVSDLLNQLRRAHEFIPLAEAEDATARLRAYLERSAYFNDFATHELTVALDCHTDNVLFTDSGDELVVIDSMFPKRNWRVMDELHTAARVAANAAVLGGADQRARVYAAYAAIGGRYAEDAALAHEVRTALMQWSRRHLLGEPELAERFKAYALSLLAELGA